jgi:hypothetical protein
MRKRGLQASTANPCDSDTVGLSMLVSGTILFDEERGREHVAVQACYGWGDDIHAYVRPGGVGKLHVRDRYPCYGHGDI